jgi:cobalt transporter subunit CbtA
MTQKLFASALFAGVAAGLIAAALQLAFVQPVLLEAELYESGERVHFAEAQDAAHDHSDHDHSQDQGAEPGELTRNLWSVAFSALVYVGYGLILVAGFALAARFGVSVDARTGLLWGVAGYVAAHLAPAAGLPPELPGSSAAEVMPRQIWWFATVAATAAGIALIAFGKGMTHFALAALLILAPHAIGAPHPTVLAGVAPPELAGMFAGRTLAVGLAAWAVLGATAGWLWSRET